MNSSRAVQLSIFIAEHSAAYMCVQEEDTYNSHHKLK